MIDEPLTHFAFIYLIHLLKWDINNKGRYCSMNISLIQQIVKYVYFMNFWQVN